MNATIRVSLGERSYEVSVGAGQLATLPVAMKAGGLQGRVFVVADANVLDPWARPAVERLKADGFDVALATVPAGETSKSADQLAQLWNAMAQQAYNRDAILVAIGGGVVGDLAGFVAGSYLRGLRWVQVPTTLLAMVDSSVGGKTGINLAAGKNLVGAFWQPNLVVADIDCLSTLPTAETRSGLAEVIKYGVIRDPALFTELEGTIGDLIALKDKAALVRVIKRSVEIKAQVVAGDERETSGLRAILNFGHTLGHAVEAEAGYSNLKHGEAVAIGMVAASLVALRRDTGWSRADHDRLEALVARAALPRRVPAGMTVASLIGRTRVDKKAAGGRVRYILPTRLGDVTMVNDVSDDTVREVLLELGASA